MTIPADMIERARSVPIENVIEARGVKLHGTVERVGPCPVCGGVDRFGINTRKQLFHCRGCSAGGDVIALEQFLSGGGFREAIETLTGVKTGYNNTRPISPVDRSNGDCAKRALASARKIIAEMRPIIGTPGEVYLRDVRKIDVAAIEDVLSRTDAIGWHPGVYFNEPEYPERGDPPHPLHGQRLGAIISVMTDAVTAEPTGAISRTYIALDGTKVLKAKTLASPRGIIRLSPDDEVGDGLIIAEGLETALSGMSIGLRPMWATGDCNIMSQFPVLAGIEALTVIADHDANGAGEKAAREVAARWCAAGREATAFMPKTLGDLNDILRGKV
jgi:phage/plasmid primase-like uncharacterized protein